MPDYGTPLAARSPQSVAVDNVLRRALRVSDPSDPDQVAKGLLTLYPDAADRIERERQGLNIRSLVEVAPMALPAGGGASTAELAQAQDDLERDLANVTGAAELKDITVELKGWGRAVRRAAADGLAAAPLALDVIQQDRAMAARRTLGDYARLARYVGVMTADMTLPFRRLAQSLDVLAALILVAIGDGLAANGTTRSSALIRVSASELRVRRDAVMAGLRTLTGSGLAALSQEEYPWGNEGYRSLLSYLDTGGQSDLRALTEEGGLGLTLDQLVDLAAGYNSDALRELATTGTILTDRLRRLIIACCAVIRPGGGRAVESPPLFVFASALQSFIDAFGGARGTRLQFIARPVIISYGLYGFGGLDDATWNLIELARLRNQIAEGVDCASACLCDPGDVERQILLDFLLSRLDRAIDLYAMGIDADGNGPPEYAATSWADLFAAWVAGGAPAGLVRLRVLLGTAAGVLQVPVPRMPEATPPKIRELTACFYAEASTRTLAEALAPNCRRSGTIVTDLIQQAVTNLGGTPIPDLLPLDIPAPTSANVAGVVSNYYIADGVGN